MTDTRFTPGPWIVSGEINARYLQGIGSVILVRRAQKDDDRYIAMASLDAMGPERSVQVQTTSDERKANATLISASPDLYAALEHAANLIADMQLNGCPAGPIAIPSIVSDSLAKARGET